MRTDKVSISQARQIIQLFFTYHFNLKKVYDSFKHQRHPAQVLASLKESIKNVLIIMEGELFAAKEIIELKIYDNVNVGRIMEEIHLLNLILSPQRCDDFLVYYKYKEQFVCRARFQLIQVPVEPITTKRKYLIYSSFMQYFHRQELFTAPPKLNGKDSSTESQFAKYNIELPPIVKGFTPEQVIEIIELYAREEQTQVVQQYFDMRRKKASKNIKDVLIRELIVGLLRVYRESNNLDRFSGISIDRFRKNHLPMMKLIEYPIRIMIMKIGVYNNIVQRDIMYICSRIGIRYRPSGYPKWLKNTSNSKIYKQFKQKVNNKLQDEIGELVSIREYSSFTKKSETNNQNSQHMEEATSEREKQQQAPINSVE